MLMLIIVSMVLPVLCLSNVKAADDQSWISKSPMPTARGGFGTAVVNGRIYAIGGINGDSPLNVNEQYDPVSDQWVSKASMPTPRSGFAIATYDNKIYVFGGSIGSGYVGNNEVYDPATNSWETKASMPTPRSDFSACVVNDRIYLMAGKKYSSNNPYFNETAVNEVYDPRNDSWTTAKAVPNAVYGYSASVIDGKIHLIGGSKNPISLGVSVLVNTNQVFDPQTGNWTISENIPTFITYGSAATTQGIMAPSNLYYIGGFYPNTYTSATQIYNLSNDSWSSGASMPTARAYLSLAVANDLIYAIGGFDGKEWLNTVEMYKPAGYGTVPPQIQVISPENKTYTSVELAFSVNRDAQWVGYSIDNQANITAKENILSDNLSQGSHTIVFFANDSAGNMGHSKVIFFSIDVKPPEIVISLPLNQTYGSTDIQLTFTVDEPTKELAYSLDSNTRIPIVGNISLPALTNGSHHLTIYATDENGNTGSQTVFFEISPFPFIVVIAAIALGIIIVAAGYLIYKRKKSAGNKEKEFSSETLVKEAARI